MLNGVGNSDCGLCITDFQERFTMAPTLVIHRPVDDVAASLHRSGIECDLGFLESMSKCNSALKGMHVHYSEINNSLEAISRHLVGEYDPDIGNEFIGKNIQRPISGSVEALNVWRV